ncbi:MAG: hypothetical protein J0G35_00130, partial [Acidobacteriales bacterium]|nr:hypothetical protein [Terriglobales bacterium]
MVYLLRLKRHKILRGIRRIIQFEDDKGARAVGATEGGVTTVVTGAGSVYALAAEAAERGL